MNQNKTPSILQRCAVVLAVTAASYGLQQAQARVPGNGGAQPVAKHAQASSQRR